MAPTQPFKPRAVKLSEQKCQEGRSREKYAQASSSRRSRSPRRHYQPHVDDRSEPRRSKSRGEQHQQKKAKRNHRYEVVKKLSDVGMDGLDAVSGSDEEYGSDLDLDKPLYSIGEYLNDRTQLVRNMFGCVKRDTLHKMLPPVLRDFSLKELQEKCVFELDGMSRKRIRALLSGQDLESSSGTDDSDDEGPPPKQSHANQLEVIAQSPAESAISSSTSADKSGDSPATAAAPDVGRRPSAAVEPTEMELVELELRAQALRAMMQQLDDADKSASSLAESDHDTNEVDADVLLDVAMDHEEGELSSDEAGLLPRGTKKRAEKDFFEIHADEEEMADIV
ncbi:hypothetical protein BV898_16760 [Hypsibius exemplaris]|uniref:Caspase activity and apoptosis inhibitor 1 n=1 Tax=Hypsibius exemplaris TaxID=2072580 RepID=A0A9X6NFY6_HYPEX|nr:hypothetical protein BV898_16760 [Hypsibius exemplaris]